MNDCRNPDGTTNGVKLFAQLTGLSEAEIAWTWKRTKQLHATGMSRAAMKAQLTEEARSRPWERSTTPGA